MNEYRNITCIVCPIGCDIRVCINEGKISSISGNKCKKGAVYAENECINPVRTLTSTVRVLGGKHAMLPVKSDRPVQKPLIFECMKQLKNCRVRGPVRIGDIIIENILDTGANIVATANLRK